MRITRLQLDILRLIQQSPGITNSEIADALRLPSRQTVADSLKGFAEDNGLPGYQWFIARINDYYLGSLKPYRERRGVMGITWATREQKWVAKYKQIWIGSFLFREDAIEAREKWISERCSENRKGD